MNLSEILSWYSIFSQKNPLTKQLPPDCIEFLAREITNDHFLAIFLCRWQFLVTLDNYSGIKSIKTFHRDLMGDLLGTVHKHICNLIVHRLQVFRRIVTMINSKKLHLGREKFCSNYEISEVYGRITDNMKVQMKKLFDKGNAPLIQSSHSPQKTNMSLLRSNTQKYFLVNTNNKERSHVCCEEVEG
jgi:hypothetical protein